MYVIPFVMGHLDAEKPMFGVEITDSRVRRRLDARDGPDGHQRAAQDGGDRRRLRARRCTRSARRSSRGRRTSPWPCNDTKYIVQFPEERMIWSYGSGYGGNSLLGKKCYALRIASVMARDEGWLAEHMLILKLTSPQGVTKYIAAAFPSACGKTNLAMLAPTIPGWKVETLGDDIAWMRIGDDGRLYAVNPEFGFFGVAPGTNENTNPNAMRTLEQRQLGVHQRRAHRGRRRLVGGHGEPAGARHVLEGRALDAGQRGAVQPPEQPLLHADQAVPDPRAGVRRPARRADRRDPVRRPAQDHHPAGDRGARLDPRHVHGRDAVLGDHRRRGRRRSAWCAATRWRCCRSSATTPATTSITGSRVGKDNDAAKLPKIFYVNWFRRDDDGGFLWPGFGENSRVLKWVVERIDGQAEAIETPIGHVPTPERAGHRRAGHDRRASSRRRCASTSRSGRPRSRRSPSGSRSSATRCRPCSGPSSTACAARLGE